MPRLVRSLLKVWHDPQTALAYVREGLAEARATACPLRLREWLQAESWLVWMCGHEAMADPRGPGIKEMLNEG